MSNYETFARLEEAYNKSTQSDNAFARELSQIKWDYTFYADGEHYFVRGKFTFTTPDLDPFGADMEWMPSGMFPDGSIIEFGA